VAVGLALDVAVGWADDGGALAAGDVAIGGATLTFAIGAAGDGATRCGAGTDVVGGGGAAVVVSVDAATAGGSVTTGATA
jgi:hypothetical protein